VAYPTQSPELALHNSCIEELSLTLDGVRWRYQKAGAGQPLLLVHGLLGYSFSWRFALPALASSATVYAVDLPGAGFSGRPAGIDCSLRAISRRLLDFMDEIGLACCDVLGTSHGGAVVMRAAAGAPERFRRLILVAPANPWSARGRFLSVLVSSPVLKPLFLELAPRLRFLHEFFLRRLYGDPRRMQPGTLEGYREPLLQPGSMEYGLSILHSWNRGMKELETMLPRIAHIPTLLIWGSADVAVDPASANRLQRNFQNARLITFNGVGHLPYEEVPEDFNRTVTEFLIS